MSPNSIPTQEAVLIKSAANGDKQAFGVLYQNYLEQIYRYIYYRIANSFEAEDITENVFLKAWEALPKLAEKEENISNFRAWLYRIAHNMIVDHHRARKPSISLDEAVSLSDSADGPELAASSNWDSQRLAAAIKLLEPNLQQVLVCRFINQISHAETARIMGLNPGHVRVLQHRALKKMAQLLEKEN